MYWKPHAKGAKGERGLILEHRSNTPIFCNSEDENQMKFLGGLRGICVRSNSALLNTRLVAGGNRQNLPSASEKTILCA